MLILFNIITSLLPIFFHLLSHFQFPKPHMLVSHLHIQQFILGIIIFPTISFFLIDHLLLYTINHPILVFLYLLHIIMHDLKLRFKYPFLFIFQLPCHKHLKQFLKCFFIYLYHISSIFQIFHQQSKHIPILPFLISL